MISDQDKKNILDSVKFYLGDAESVTPERVLEIVGDALDDQ